MRSYAIIPDTLCHISSLAKLKNSTCTDDLRVSTASGSELGFRKGLIDGA